VVSLLKIGNKIIVLLLILLFVLSVSVSSFACDPYEYESFSGFYRVRCVPNSCGLFWLQPQKYLVEIWQSPCPYENGEYTREGAVIHAGFGVCC